MDREAILLEIEKFIPTFNKLESKDFMELYNSNKDFYQIVFYDRRKDYTGYKTILNVTEMDKIIILEELKFYNSKLDEMFKKHNINWFNKVGDNVGFCYIDTFFRNKQKEEKEEEEMQDYDEYYEPVCSSCGDGGCVHCEPHRFI